MDKREFLEGLGRRLSGLASKDREERLAFYGEMIDDRMDEGLSEEAAVAAVGSAEEIAAQILGETPAAVPATEQTGPKRKWEAWWIVLLILGAPLGISAVSVGFSLYVSWWAVIVSAWAVFGSLIAAAVGAVISGVVCFCMGQGLPGLAVIAGGLICTGLSVFAFFACRAVTKGTVLATKRAVAGLKKLFTGKENAQ